MSTKGVASPGRLRSSNERSVAEVILDVLHQGGEVSFRRDEYKRCIVLTVSNQGTRSERLHLLDCEMNREIRLSRATILALSLDMLERNLYG